MKYLIFFFLFIACQQEETVFNAPHNCTVSPICDTGGDCHKGVVVTHLADYAERLYIEAYLPPGIWYCSGEYRTGVNGDGYIQPEYEEIIEGYYYAYIWVPANTTLTAWFGLSNELPIENGITNFGEWRTHFNQLEFPSIHYITYPCN